MTMTSSPLDDLDAVERRTNGWRTSLTRSQGLAAPARPGAVAVERVEVAVDELDGLEQAAGGLALPDFAEAAAAERLDEAVAGNRFRIWLP